MGAHLEVHNLTMRFAGVLANDGIDLEVRPGEIVGLIGPNGAGKTTCFNCVTGFLRPSEGRIVLDAEDVTVMAPASRAARGMARTFQQSQLFEHLTVEENLLLGTHVHYGAPVWQQLFGLPNARAAERAARDDVHHIAAELQVQDVLGRGVDDLPYGTRRLVEVARALAARPRVLLLDEPGAGLDTSESAAFGAVLQQAAAERDLSVLLIEHDVDLVLAICDRIYVLDFGRLIASGTPSEIRRDPEVRAAYLGTQGAVVDA